MNILFNTILFIIGMGIGCFLSIEAKEIPRNLDLRKTHYSNYKNEEILSRLTYILIGGLASVIFANTLNINFHELDISKLIIYLFAMIYISTLIVIAGIDRSYSKISKETLSFGIMSSILYMFYLCVIDLVSIHLNAIYLGIYIVLLIIDTFLLRKFAKDSYIINILLLLVTILVFTDLRTLTYTAIMALIAIILYVIMLKFYKKRNGNKKIKINEIPVGYFISASNIIVLFIIRIFENYCI